jgi:glycine reductase
MDNLAGRKVIAIGERDGISGQAIAACVEAAGGTVVFDATECFV